MQFILFNSKADLNFLYSFLKEQLIRPSGSAEHQLRRQNSLLSA